MREYELRLRFTAADGLQASRLAEAWADTCAAEYGTRYAGLRCISDWPPGVTLADRLSYGGVAAMEARRSAPSTPTPPTAPATTPLARGEEVAE